MTCSMKEYWKVLILFSLTTVLFTSALFGQQRKAEERRYFQGAKIELSEDDKSPQFVQFKTKSQPTVFSFFQEYRKSFPLTAADEMRPVRQFTDALGETHHRYQQYFNGLEVIGAQYILHEKKDLVKTANGRIVHGLSLNTQAGLSEDAARQAALDYISADSYMWEDPDREAFLRIEQNDPNATFFPNGELKLTSGRKELHSENVVLVYRFDIYAAAPLGRYWVDVNANTGEIVNVISRMQHVDASASGASHYNGDVNFTADQFTGNPGMRYRLRETARGGIQTYNMNSDTNFVAATDFESADTSFSDAASRSGVSVHWAMEGAYDYFANQHGRNGFDGANAMIFNYANFGQNVNNAFWDGSRFSFGGGDGFNYGPMTAVEIAGHEFAHAVTENAANLIFANEPGALNESFSDIFGTVIEFQVEGLAADWLKGEDVVLNGMNPVGDFANPNQYGLPDTYVGNYWGAYADVPAPENDYGNVHTNSWVHNYWFYLLSEGGSGVNDHGTAYSVSGIGMADAAAIAYRNLTVYLTPTSSFNDARLGSIEAAKDLFGNNSSQRQAVEAAWTAIGVVEPPPTADILVWDGKLGGQDYSGAFIANYLTDAGFNVTHTEDFPNTLIGFDAVFLCFGNFGDGNDNTEFNDGMASDVETYLEAGGNLYLEGGDALGFDQSNNNTLLELFGIETAIDGGTNPINDLEGENDALTVSMHFTSSSQVRSDFIDEYSLAGGTKAFTEPQAGTVAVQHSGSNGQKTFVFAYALGGLDDFEAPSTKDDFMGQLVSFMVAGNPILNTSASTLSFTVPLDNPFDSQTIAIFNTGNGVLNWQLRDREGTSGKTGNMTAGGFDMSSSRVTGVIDMTKLRSGDETRAKGDVLDDFDAPGTPFPIGLAYDPEFDEVWVTDEPGGKIYRIEKDSPYRVRKTITPDVNFPTGPYDVAVWGNALYVTDFNGGGNVDDAIYAINKDNGNLIELWELDGAGNPNPNDEIGKVIGIAVNDDGEFFISNDNNEVIRQVDLKDGGDWETVSTFISPFLKRVAGMHWDTEQKAFWLANIRNSVDNVFLADANFNAVDSFPEPVLDSKTSGITAVGNSVIWVSDFLTGKIYVIEGPAPVCGWLAESEVGGAIGAGGNSNIDIMVDATGLTEGTYQCHLTLSSNDPNNNSTIIPVTLNVVGSNVSPMLTDITNQAIDEGDTLIIPVTTNNPDGNDIFLAMNQLTQPAFAEFADSGNGTGSIKVTAGYEDAGTYSGLQILARDNGVPVLTDTVTFDLLVNDINRAPALDSIPDTTMIETDTLDIPLAAFDPDDDRITLLLDNLGTPQFASLSDSGDGTGVLRLLPGRNDAGFYTIRVIATDSIPPDTTVKLKSTAALTDTMAFNILITNINQAPVISAIADTNMSEGDTLDIPMTFTDPEGDSLIFSFENVPAFAALTDSGNGNGTLRLTPGYFAFGQYDSIQIIVSDSSLENGSDFFTDTTSFSLSVTDVNRAPIVTAIPDTMVDEGDTLSIAVTAADPDSNEVSLSISHLPTFAQFVDSGNGSGMLQFTPSFTESGEYADIRIFVEDIINAKVDTVSLSDSTIFSLTVNDKNRPPLLAAIADTVMAEEDTLQIFIAASDADSDSISLAVEDLPAFGAFVDAGNGTGVIEFITGFENAGNYLMKVLATDNGTPNRTDSLAFFLTVNGVNRAPAVAAIEDQAMNENDVLDIPIFSTDADSDNVALAVLNLPSFASLTDSGNGNGMIRMAPGFNDAGEYANIEIRAIDNGAPSLFGVRRFSLTVNNLNRTPAAVNDTLNIDEDDQMIIDVLANDSDPDNNSLTIIEILAENTHGDVGFSDGDTTIAYTPEADSSGNDAFAYVVDDGAGGLDTASVLISIAAVNDAPRFVNFPESISMSFNDARTFNMWEFVDDPESSDSLLIFSFTLTSNAVFFSYDLNNGQLDLSTVNVAAETDVNMITTVIDPGGKIGSDTLLIKVREVVGIEPIAGGIPVEYELQQNYPNPFNPSTQIRFGLPNTSEVRVDIINILGQRVATLVNERRAAGYHAVTFDARDISSGVYFYHIRARSITDPSAPIFKQIRKMILLK